MVLATKFGNLGGRGGKVADGRPEFVISSCEASLKRLGVDVIDLYYQHRIDPTVPTEDTVGAMAKLVEQGKVRALGLSEASPQTIRRGHAVHKIAAVQNEFSLLYRAEGEETLRTTRQLGIAFVAYSPLGRGLLTGAIEDPTTLADNDARKRHPRFAAENIGHNLGLVQKIAELSKEKLHAGPARPGMAARPGRRHRADPRDQAQRPAHREHRRVVGQAERRRPSPDFQRHTGRRRCRLALSRRADEERLRLSAGSAGAAPQP